MRRLSTCRRRIGVWPQYKRRRLVHIGPTYGGVYRIWFGVDHPCGQLKLDTISEYTDSLPVVVYSSRMAGAIETNSPGSVRMQSVPTGRSETNCIDPSGKFPSP